MLKLDIKFKRTGRLATRKKFTLSAMLLRTVERLGLEGEQTSKKSYLSQRQSSQSGSLIFSSFKIDNKMRVNEASSTVFAGGPTATWAKWVDVGHGFYNKHGGAFIAGPSGKTHFEGYHFMNAGMEKVRRILMKVVKEELKKEFR